MTISVEESGPHAGRNTQTVFAGPSTASTIRGLVSRSRTALVVQVVIGLVALAAAAGSVFVLRDAQIELGEVRTEAETLREETAALRSEIGDLELERDGLTNAMPYLRRAHQAWAQGQLDVAVQAFNDALGEAPNDADTLSSLAQVYFAQGNAADAARWQAEALQHAGASAAIVDYARLIAYQCASGNAGGAAATVAAAPAGFAAAVQFDRQTSALIAGACGQTAPELTAMLSAASAGTSTVSEGDRAEANAASAFQVRIIYLHIRDEADRADAERLAVALRQANYRVPGIELVESPRGYGPNVRYYYEQQADQSRAITELAVNAARELGLAGWSEWQPRQVSLAGRYDRLPSDRVEIWLPPRS
jgi:hypothetical protein